MRLRRWVLSAWLLWAGANHLPLTRELHTGLSPDKLPFARRGQDIPGALFRRSRNQKKCGRPFVRWPELRPDKSGPAQTGPRTARSPTETQWLKPAPAEHPPRRRSRSPGPAAAKPAPKPFSFAKCEPRRSLARCDVNRRNRSPHGRMPGLMKRWGERGKRGESYACRAGACGRQRGQQRGEQRGGEEGGGEEGGGPADEAAGFLEGMM